MADPVETMYKAELIDEAGKQPNIEEQRQMKVKNSTPRIVMAGAVLVIALAGTGTGYALAQMAPSGPGNGSVSAGSVVIPESAEAVEAGKTYGADDDETFTDDVTGILVKGGIEGEGSHHLIRPGGKSQYVYLTSSVVDLDLFVGAEVEIWGETFNAQKAGWLLDAGRVKVLRLDAASETETYD
jgi:hypothetical protein